MAMTSERSTTPPIRCVRAVRMSFTPSIGSALSDAKSNLGNAGSLRSVGLELSVVRRIYDNQQPFLL